ncbi:MAG: hypothetical protein ACSHXY_05510 [Alphaproteobacteria bacterium]
MNNIKVLISAPSDQEKEIKEVFQAIENFNDIMLKRDICFTPVHWQKNIATGISDRPQNVINDQISDCNMIIAIVGTRMGTPTEKADSGTAEEVFDFCGRSGFSNTSYNTHVFFNTFYGGNVLGLDLEQLDKVKKFQSDIGDLGVLYAPFSNLSTLNKLVTKALDSFFFQSEQTQSASLEEDEIEELGLDDFVENTIVDFQSVSSLVIEIGEDMTAFSIEAAEATQVGEQSVILTKGIEAINKLAGKITHKVKGSQHSLDSAYSNLNSALKIAVEDFMNEENINDLEELVESLKVLITSGREGQVGIQSLEDTIRGLPRRNKKLIKSRNRILIPISGLKNSLSDFNNNVELVIGEVEREIESFHSQ